MNKYDAVLSNWKRFQVSGKEFVLCGIVENDNKDRFNDLAVIKTSPIKNRPVKQGDIVQTRNSKYLLGEEAK